MRTVAIIQARLGSTRLPGKVLLPVQGRPLLAHVVERALMIPGVDVVVVASTTAPADRAILEAAPSLGARSFAGSEQDVLDRFRGAAAQESADHIVRITADCPLLDPVVSGRVLERYRAGDVDYVSNTTPPTFPDGLDTEVFSRAALERAWLEARLQSEREHVTPFIWKNPGLFRVGAIVSAIHWSHLRWTVDSPADLEFVRAVFGVLRTGQTSHEDVLEVLRANPSLEALNIGQQRNEGYLKSLRMDEE